LVLPNTANDFISEEEQVANAIAHNAAAVCIRPIQNGWLTDPWCSGDLMKALEERRMPVLAADGQVSIGDVVTLAENYPQLPIILADNNYRDQRIIAPLMKQFKNVYLSTGLRYNSHMGLEHLAETCSIERILFGSGWPQTEASASITYITYADLSDDEKAMIGSGNIKRLIEAIVK
ncbi:MAG: amidohydrolase family protein, partial [Lentisphaeria bacterium]|nr:amidohydrolase family protein [Lentisphaeria bacterium]NQZ68810.1 amidohydrolase family protein [Lentisphaeria bacterium]